MSKKYLKKARVLVCKVLKTPAFFIGSVPGSINGNFNLNLYLYAKVFLKGFFTSLRSLM